MKKGIAILGSTGSIGKQSLEIISAFPSFFKVVAIAAKDFSEDLVLQIKTFGPSLVSISTEEEKNKLISSLQNTSIKIVVGDSGLIEAATHKDAKIVIVAIPGSVALPAALEAVKAKKDIALATKEVLVAAGALFMSEAKNSNVKVFPIDSEHSAIAQCLVGEKIEKVKKIIITASGGPFLKTPKEKLHLITPKEALAHPTWKMGHKVTIDSSTLMNKGFEVIEAHYLFGLAASQIEVIIHPQSIIHSMVEFVDGSIKAQLGAADMRVPIQLALFGMEHNANRWNRLDLLKIKSLTFEKPDLEKFPCLKLSYDALNIGGTMPTVLNAANETAVNLFLKGKLSFMAIPEKIKASMDKHQTIQNPDISQILEVDKSVKNSEF